MQDFHVDALEKLVEESSLPVVTVFNSEPSNHPFVIKFFNNPNAKVIDLIKKCVSFVY
jgi:protein disulfide-isomerase A1